jgi:hypothetical protein
VNNWRFHLRGLQALATAGATMVLIASGSRADKSARPRRQAKQGQIGRYGDLDQRVRVAGQGRDDHRDFDGGQGGREPRTGPKRLHAWMAVVAALRRR